MTRNQTASRRGSDGDVYRGKKETLSYLRYAICQTGYLFNLWFERTALPLLDEAIFAKVGRARFFVPVSCRVDPAGSGVFGVSRSGGRYVSGWEGLVRGFEPQRQ